MTAQQIAAQMADALAIIAGMPVVDQATGLTVEKVSYQYHEALQIARDTVAAYARWEAECPANTP
jgi:hypothetical protein